MTPSNHAADEAGHPSIVEPDAHGQAALLLTESLIHMLVERRAITNTEAVEVVQIAAEVKVEVATSAGESVKRMKESLTLLAKMQSSFESDQPDDQDESNASG